MSFWLLRYDELSVREEHFAPGSLGGVAEGLRHGAQGRGQVILLVHGYWNSAGGARKSYDRLRKNLRGRPAISWAERSVFNFYWPSNEARFIPVMPSYVRTVENAKWVAERLANYLSSLRGPNGQSIRIFLIGHSLGCRVILETLRELLASAAQQPNSNHELSGICLMAAAVSVSMVEENPKGNLVDGVKSADRRCCLHSRCDDVLFFLFRGGQWLAGEGGQPAPEAVGRFGNPAKLWTQSEEMLLYGHGDYWKDARTAEPVAEFLGEAVSNKIASRSTPIHRLAPPNDPGRYSSSQDQ